MKKNLLSTAIAAAIIVPALPAFAQEDAATVEEVVVTGSRLRTSQTQTAVSPVTEIDAEDFTLNGATTVEDLVNQYPQLDMNFDNVSNNPSTGYATASLRGLGASRTLSLVNGRRLPGGYFETTDLSIVPAAALKRADVLSGGASTVYGADAVAGVVNFVLNDEFEGTSVNVGWQGFQHDNDNLYMQNLMDEAGYDYPTGSDIGGESYNLDVMFGTAFAEGRGHVVGWTTYRENEALFQGERDYSSCALGHNAAGEFCGGSGTADPANFSLGAADSWTDAEALAWADNDDNVWYNSDGNGGFTPGTNLYNYAPINYYQRPDERYTAGGMVKFEVNEHFTPYAEAMYLQRTSSVQIAESGTFGLGLEFDCDDPIIGTLCEDTGITAAGHDDVTVSLWKRNTEGGPRFTERETTTYRLTFGGKGAINDSWEYDASFTYGESNADSKGTNDFLFSRIEDAVRGCPAGSFEGCLPYDIWNDNITSEAASAMAGVSSQSVETSNTTLNAFASGDLGFGLPSAKGETIGVVAGFEYREDTFVRVSDENSLAGNFAGSGGADTNLDESIDVTEVFFEASIPFIVNEGVLDSFGAELGYRYSDYSTSGGVSTYKVGLAAQFAENYRVRGGWNRAIRAPGLNDLYEPSYMALWSGSDPCAGADPEFTEAQCALTGVPGALYGSVPENPAGQYNQYTGGNAELVPEEANTYTLGLAATPTENLELAVDYFNIEIEDAISTIGASTKLTACAENGIFCNDIQRLPNGALWQGQTVDNAGLVFNQIGNNGILQREGFDLSGSYIFGLADGEVKTSIVSTYMLKHYNEPIPGDSESAYDCAGEINVACPMATPEWRHVVSSRYSADNWSVGMRWRLIGASDFVHQLTGEPLGRTTDPFLSSGGRGVEAYSYVDLSAAIELGLGTLTMGVNNVWDKEPPLVSRNLTHNGNALQGYDQSGRYLFTSFTANF
ncbi:TonB-dependent receptor domain-containing protein [Microbulbifer aggregans]|uniref:TonB-dependent receptor domain-containing protein n=1 Tax=Microbulbifer aggregans TaxID=1769779 RepID=UPI001CFEDC63|nr:TonB-dependent receptor [Microbulbifer aggregans]